MKINAEVRSVWSYEHDLQKLPLADPEIFGIWINFSVGEKDIEGADDFQIFVCSPQHLSIKLKHDICAWGYHMLIIPTYSYSGLRKALDRLVTDNAKENIQKTMVSLAKFAAWEFEDYDPSPT